MKKKTGIVATFLIASFYLQAQTFTTTVSAPRFNIAEAWDNVVASTDNGKSYEMIGTYRGWDENAVFIAGYNAFNNNTYATDKVVIGNHVDSDHFMMVNLMNGNVGIGTTNTSEYKLSVNGDIRAKKIKITATGWPDYVFSSKYKLRSLLSLESFIKKNNHLPEVPSAMQVEKEGVDMALTQAVLLTKIEELTLYVIKQGKEIKFLEEKVSRLKK